MLDRRCNIGDRPGLGLLASERAMTRIACKNLVFLVSPARSFAGYSRMITSFIVHNLDWKARKRFGVICLRWQLFTQVDAAAKRA
jgi:hypothetical protein